MSTEALLSQSSEESEARAGDESAYYQNFAIAAGPLGGLLVYFAFLTDQDSQKLAAMFAILLWVCVWWMTEAVPVAITALLPLFLFPLLQIIPADEVAKAYMNDTISLFLGSFILALAVQKHHCHKRLALKTLLVFGGGKMDPRTLLLGFCAGPAFVSMFMSNTAVAVMMIPMAVGVVQRVKNSPAPEALPHNSKHEKSSSGCGEEGCDKSSPSGDGEKGCEKSATGCGEKVYEKTPSGEEKTYENSHIDVEKGYGEIVPGYGDFGPDESSSAKILSEYSKGVVLAVGYAVGIGGMTTLTGTGPNLVFSGVFRSLFPEAEAVTYTQWLMFGFPMGVFFLLLLWGILCVMYCPPDAVHVVAGSLSRSAIQKEYDSLGAMDSAEKTVVSLFTVLAFMWMTRATNGDVPGWGSYFHNYAADGTVSILMAMFLFILPFRNRAGQKLMSWGDCKKLPWDIVLVLGGGFALADGIRQSGLSEWISAHLYFLHSIPYLLITPAVAVIVAIVTEFTSNNATATIFLPLLAEVSLTLNTHPLFLMVTATLASSFSFMLPIATPPNAVAYTAGKLKMTDLAFPGFLLKCTGIFLLSVLMPTLGNVVFNLDEKFQN